jgi:hypothetical protein
MCCCITRFLRKIYTVIVFVSYDPLIMSHNSIQNEQPIFSYKEHTEKVKKALRIKRLKFFGYHTSKLFIVALLFFGIIGAGTFSVFAGNKQYRHSGNHKAGNTNNKRVQVRAGNTTEFNGRSHSRASVSNNNSVHISQGSRGGYAPRYAASKRSNNGRNHHSNKKVVRKVIRKNINKTYNYTTTAPDYSSCSYDCYTQHTAPTNPCGSYGCQTSSNGMIIIYNSNTNTNTNQNYNTNENYTSSRTHTYLPHQNTYYSDYK